jgi:hypothetical protein
LGYWKRKNSPIKDPWQGNIVKKRMQLLHHFTPQTKITITVMIEQQQLTMAKIIVVVMIEQK